MDNFGFDITSDSHLEEALKIAFKGAPGGKATHFRIEPPISADDGYPRLVLGWNEKMKDSQPLIHTLTAESSVALIEGWLRDQQYGSQPDHDGDNGRGWRVYNESWGHVGHDRYAFVAIEPAWAMYGK